jgi:gluconolactonase
MPELRLLAEGLQFPEGPIAMSDGSVVLVEIKRGTLTRVSPDGSNTVVATCGGGPNGSAVGPDGKVYVCNNGGFEWISYEGMDIPGPQPEDYIGGRIQRVDLDTGQVDDVYTACGDVPLRGPNDLVFDNQGGFYFTDLGKTRGRVVDRGAIYYAQPDGSDIRELVYPMDHPNGIGLSPDGSRLYVAETITGRVWAWELAGPGQLGTNTGIGVAGATLVTTLTNFQLLDSLAIDGEGNVCLATLISGGITVVSPSGELVEFVQVPGDDRFVTNICFGGEDLRTAYITSSGYGKLYAADWSRPGLALNYSA